MRYLVKYKLYENLAQAKSFLKSLNIPETNEDFVQLKSILNRNMGYLGWFTKMCFEEEVGLEELKDFYIDVIKGEPEVISDLPNNLITYNNWEKLMDDVISVRNNIKLKKMLNEFPHLQKSLISGKNLTIQIKDLLIRLFDKPNRRNFISKISRYKTTKELVESLHSFVNTDTGINFRSVLNSVIRSGAKIIYKDEANDLIITKVDHDQLVQLAGDTSWCIKSEYTFRSYSDGCYQYIIFLTDVTGNMSKIGVTVGLNFRTAHAINDSYVSEESLIKILDERGFDFNKLKIPLSEVINTGTVQSLLAKGISKEEILKSKKKFTVNDLRSFTEEEIEKYKILDRAEITKTQFFKEKRDFKYLMDNIDRISFKLTYNDLIALDPTNEELLSIYENDVTISDNNSRIQLEGNILDSDALNKINALISNSTVPLEVIRNTGKSFSQIGFILKYCGVTSDDYTLEEIVERIRNVIDYHDKNGVKYLVEYLNENGWSEDLKSPQICNSIVNKVDFSNFYTKFKYLLDVVECGLEGCKDIVRTIFNYIIEGKQHFRVYEVYCSDNTLVDIYDSHVDIIKNNFGDIADKVLHRRDVGLARKHLSQITPSGRIMGQGLFIEHAKSYMRSKGRTGLIISPQDYYDDFFEIMSTEYWNPSGLSGGHETKRITLYMILCLVKLGKIDEISKMKIYWTYEYVESIVKYILSGARYDSFVGELGAIEQDYSKFAQDFLLNEEEGEQLLNYLLQNVKNDKMYYPVSNSRYEDDDLERHRIFSLVYYIKGWGFDRYLRLVESHKYKGGKNGGRKIINENDKEWFINDRYRVEYLKDILEYLAYKNKKDEFMDLRDKILSWDCTKDEKEYTEMIIKNSMERFKR